ncbi:MAG: hypothetical protein RL164_498 [Bacteroidota bacterium]|jgi:hypothetical protein
MKSNQIIQRFLYGGFTALGIYKIVTGHFGDAAMYFGIALAFDPFDQTITWKVRPFWQRAWLVVHLAICAGSLGMEIGLGD